MDRSSFLYGVVCFFSASPRCWTLFALQGWRGPTARGPPHSPPEEDPRS